MTGDELIAVLTDLCCRIRVAARRSTSHEPKAVLTSVAGLVQELLTEADGFGVQVRARHRRLGRRGPGGRGGALLAVPGVDDVPLAELAATTTGLPVTLDNDVRALTVAEQWFGAGVGLSHFALVTVGAGIGCGLVVHGQVVAGVHGVAGEIGHVAIDPAGPRCHCGNRGCVEAIASDPAIVGRIREVTGASVADATAALALAHDGDPGAREVYARAGAAIGRAHRDRGQSPRPRARDHLRRRPGRLRPVRRTDP